MHFILVNKRRFAYNRHYRFRHMLWLVSMELENRTDVYMPQPFSQKIMRQLCIQESTVFYFCLCISRVQKSIHKAGKINKIRKQWEKGEFENRLPLWQIK